MRPFAYTCLCCGHTESFASTDGALNAGWDVAPYFTLQPLCNLCPTAPIVIGGLVYARQRHALAHAAWQRDGRPKEWDVDTELAIDGISGADAEAHKAGIDAIRRLVERMKH